MHLQSTINTHRQPVTFFRSHSHPHLHMGHAAEFQQKAQLRNYSKPAVLPGPPPTQFQVMRSNPHQHHPPNYADYYMPAQYPQHQFQQQQPLPVRLVYMTRQLVQVVPSYPSTVVLPNHQHTDRRTHAGDGGSIHRYNYNLTPATKFRPPSPPSSITSSSSSSSCCSAESISDGSSYLETAESDLSRTSSPEAEPVILKPSAAFFQFILSDSFDPDKIYYTKNQRTTLATRKTSRYLSFIEKNYDIPSPVESGSGRQIMVRYVKQSRCLKF